MTYHLSNEDLTCAVDLEVIKTRTKVPSESTQTRLGFRDKFLQRDVRCVWTGAGPDASNALHIIPYKRGSEVCTTIFWEDV